MYINEILIQIFPRQLAYASGGEPQAYIYGASSDALSLSSGPPPGTDGSLVKGNSGRGRCTVKVRKPVKVYRVYYLLEFIIIFFSLAVIDRECTLVVVQ